MIHFSLNSEPCPPRECFTGPTYVFTNLTGPTYVGWLQGHPWAGVHSPPTIFDPHQLDQTPPFIPEKRGPSNQPQGSANQARTLFIFLKNPTILTTVPNKPNVNSVFNSQVGQGLTDQRILFKNLDEEITDEETRR